MRTAMLFLRTIISYVRKRKEKQAWRCVTVHIKLKMTIHFNLTTRSYILIDNQLLNQRNCQRQQSRNIYYKSWIVELSWLIVPKHQYDFIYQNSIVIISKLSSVHHNSVIIYIKSSNKAHLQLLYSINTVIKTSTSRPDHVQYHCIIYWNDHIILSSNQLQCLYITYYISYV